MIEYSAVIPVYNSANIVGKTIDRTAAFFETHELSYEIILINDGSTDASWQVIAERAREQPGLFAIDLLKNYGQHTAIFCGLQASRGRYVVTLDDDLQNPPEEIAHLIAAAEEGHDLVFGQFRAKQHNALRQWGSLVVRWLNQRMFNSPPDLVLSNFRLMHRDVVDRICSYRTAYPYITGLALMFAASPANALVRHDRRAEGGSSYNLVKLLRLVARILFNYSAFPLRLTGGIGLVVAAASFVFALVTIVQRLVGAVTVPGWASVVVMLSFFNGLIILILSMLGEYLIRLVNQTSTGQIYHIREQIHRDHSPG
ncbi:MAG: glycosyltransferase family 2 protein [Chloroflexi bacterium]|nr:glycosyltransferase family 2 protein [Chloroflexota bacterium]